MKPETNIPNSGQQTTVKDVIPVNVLNEVREYTNLPIHIKDSPFPKNHLYCVRGISCEFAEQTDFVSVYIYPSTPLKEEGYTKGEIYSRKIEDSQLHEIRTSDGLIYMARTCFAPTSEANAARIVYAWNNISRVEAENEALVEALKLRMKQYDEVQQIANNVRKENEQLKADNEKLLASNKELTEAMEQLIGFLGTKWDQHFYVKRAKEAIQKQSK